MAAGPPSSPLRSAGPWLRVSSGCGLGGRRAVEELLPRWVQQLSAPDDRSGSGVLGAEKSIVNTLGIFNFSFPLGRMSERLEKSEFLLI